MQQDRTHLTEKSYELETSALLVCGSHFNRTKYASTALWSKSKIPLCFEWLLGVQVCLTVDG